MRELFIPWEPRPASRRLVDTANRIIREYQADGYTLTLRQLYYQFVARDIIANSERSYKNIGGLITKARMAGMISWEAIEDRNRQHHGFYFEENEETLIEQLQYGISFDQWERQATYVEVWVEKEALGNVVSRACRPLLVPYMACKGYLSASEAWRAGKRFEEKLNEDKRCVLIHLGDHDPSGIDMTRDNKDRLNLFSNGEVEVVRIALNMDQVDQYGPPPNPTKVTDSRADGYIERFGHTSWELDALEPQVIERLIIDEVTQHIDSDEWAQVTDLEDDKRAVLQRLYEHWDEIKDQL